MIKTLFLTVWAAAAGSTGKEAAAGGFTALFGLVATFLGGWDQGMQILITLMVIDYISGVLGAIKTKSIDSDVMFWGGIRKITILVVIGLATNVDTWLHLSVVRVAALYFYAGREGLSVVENLGTLGVPLPPAIKNFLVQLQTKGDGTDAGQVGK